MVHRLHVLDRETGEPVELDLDNYNQFPQGDVITWQVLRKDTEDSLDYAAIKSRSYKFEDDHKESWLWYITGAGHFYGTPVVTSLELDDILHRPEVRTVWVNKTWENLTYHSI